MLGGDAPHVSPNSSPPAKARSICREATAALCDLHAFHARTRFASQHAFPRKRTNPLRTNR